MRVIWWLFGRLFQIWCGLSTGHDDGYVLTTGKGGTLTLKCFRCGRRLRGWKIRGE